MDLGKNPHGGIVRSTTSLAHQTESASTSLAPVDQEGRSNRCRPVDQGSFCGRPQGSIQGFAIAMSVATKSSTVRVTSSALWLRQIAAI